MIVSIITNVQFKGLYELLKGGYLGLRDSIKRGYSGYTLLHDSGAKILNKLVIHHRCCAILEDDGSRPYFKMLATHCKGQPR